MYYLQTRENSQLDGLPVTITGGFAPLGMIYARPKGFRSAMLFYNDEIRYSSEPGIS